MGIKWFDFIRPKTGKTRLEAVDICAEIQQCAQEFRVRELCFNICVNMIANAISRCEVRTFRNRKEIREKEYYLWNVEPNINQNSTAFWHKLVYKLCTENEVLLISTRRRDGLDALVIADDWQAPKEYPAAQREYKGVKVGEITYDKTFRENDVIHLTLNHVNVKPVIDAMYQSYFKLYDAAVRAQLWGKGQHWKVHIDQMAQGDDDQWQSDFNKYIQDQVKPFLDSNGAVLPEFDGYTFTNAAQKDGRTNEDSRDIRALVDDIMDFTASALQIPPVLVKGNVEATGDATKRWMTGGIDPICDQLQEEITRKRYGYSEWAKGNYVRVDSSSIQHFDLFANAPNVEKLVGSGAFTINDILREANKEPINEPWADTHFMTLNIGDIASARSMEAQKGGNAE